MWRPHLVALALALAATGCGGGDEGEPVSRDASAVSTDAGPVHVHGLGINPKDGALFIATHTGLFRAGAKDRTSARVADRFQDTMGFTVVGPDRFLGSGHPDPRERQPPFLGLIESRDAGASWKPVSLQGERDFHVLEAQGGHVYGYGTDFDSREATLLASDDGGRTWQERTPPEPLVSLAIDPGDPNRIIASGESSLHRSVDGGRRWRSLGGKPALVAWMSRERVFAVNFEGAVLRSDGAGGDWREVGDIGGEPAAFEGGGPDELYVALHDGTVKRSTDGGGSWAVRSTP